MEVRFFLRGKESARSNMMENEYMVETRTLMFMMEHTNERQLTNYSAVMPARILYELRKQMPHPQPLNLEIFNQLIA